MFRTFLLSLLAALTVQVAFAQVPNNGFEVWNSMGTYENPDGWGTMNDATASSSIFTAEKDSPGSPGSSFLKLTSKTVGNTVVNGIAVSGVLDTLTMQPVSGFAFNQRPASFGGRWQHMIFGSSQGSIVVTLTRWDTLSATRVTVATATKNLTGMAMSWANFTIPFTYTDGQNPDTCIIVMKASGANPTQDDYLWVDNLSFTGAIAAINPANSLNVAIGPNPCEGLTKIHINTENEQMARIEVVTLAGAVVYSFEQLVLPGDNSITMDLKESTCSSGLYLVRLKMNEGVSVLPLAIQ